MIVNTNQSRIIFTSIKYYLEGTRVPGDIEAIHERGKNRGGLLRIPPISDSPVIVKYCRIENVKDKIKSILRISNAAREWRMNKYVYKNGIKIPEPLDYMKIKLKNRDSYEVIAIKDLGTTERGVPLMKRLLHEGDEGKIDAFNNFIIETSKTLLNIGIIDVDNQLNNYLIDSSGTFWRIDFECAHIHKSRFLYRHVYVVMLERLFRSYIHAVYPYNDRAVKFIKETADRLSLSNMMKKNVATILDKELKRERMNRGIPYSVTLDW